MKKTRRHKTIDTSIREVLAENIRRLMDQRYPEGSRLRQLARETHLSISTLQRVLECDTGATVDTMSSIARVFRMPPYKLLIKAEEARFFIDAREVVSNQQRDAGHSPGHRTDRLRRG